ncbi:hypothetical protein DACRYDRAFT_114601 [Dacryopinax primogenitus]|uniref:Uncharacterized protein n=1 Tax=Dacryopinax primogenitus (strain DJM 731) TaxID=1858805 RepID=M5G219_DACPD|nr:uncharacterized protein DACRYDRAFT_114601 [Dacryopinax primogenitus]EJU04231.1 hypothetical protein DACRYDRAFT_114601 [Dacryopinax primogenitus]
MISRILRPSARTLPRLSPTVAQRRWVANDPDGWVPENAKRVVVQQSTTSIVDEHDSHDHHGNPAEDALPTEESFFTPFWRNITILGALGYAAYLFMPTAKPGEKNMFTDLLTNQGNSNEEGLNQIETRVSFANAQAEHKKDADEVERPPIHRFRSKTSFELQSPFLVPVGSQADMSNVKVKTWEDSYRK